MHTLLNERFAPITSSIGYLRQGLDQTVEALAGWSRSVVDEVTVEEVEDGFPQALRVLEPLTGGVRPRELLVEASDGWTAYFDCSIRGTDAVGTVSYLAGEVGCQGLAIRTVPHTVDLPGIRNGRFGSVQFEMFGPLQTEFLNYVRSIETTFDGSRWVFGADGTEQWFEETDAYRARRIRDRFTSAMLERYCKALDLMVFDAAAYGPRAVVIRSRVKVPPDALVMSLEQAQQWLEIVPGMADRLKG